MTRLVKALAVVLALAALFVGGLMAAAIYGARLVDEAETRGGGD